MHGIWVPGPGSYGRNDAGDTGIDAAWVVETDGTVVAGIVPKTFSPQELDTDACAVPDAEVEIDRRTGKVWARKFTVAHDCGLIINPDGLRRSGVRLRGASMTPQRPEPALASARRRGMGLGEARPYP